jgi:predicted AlkP superfamily pyrophosphatase or phosphodiesterase
MKRHWMVAVAACSLFASGVLHAQEQLDRPRLVVGIVVDQMRYDYLYRYYDAYGLDGFKRLLNEGFSCENTLYNYWPTYTGPGHAAIYTGTTPSVNGIIANEWYDRQWGRHRYVTTDTLVEAVGASKPDDRSGRHSPRVLLSSTISDELRLAFALKSKVVGICLKDRGSILPAGHFPDACYWFDDRTGNWITSTYYAKQLPDWVAAFNRQEKARQYLDGVWDKLQQRPYRESYDNWRKYTDGNYKPMSLVWPRSFPYDLRSWRDSLYQKYGYSLLRFVPEGNTITVDFAMAAIEKMELGQDEYPDMLCLSFSTPDYCGHQFGIHAEEVQDVYLRLDVEIARLLRFLEEKLGKDNVLVFLTADHGAAETPLHLQDLQAPAGVFPESRLKDTLNTQLQKVFGQKKDYVLAVHNQQLWFNHRELGPKGLQTAMEVARTYLRAQPGVYDAMTKEEIMRLPAEYPFVAETRRGLHPRRSGDMVFFLEPGWHADDEYFGKGGTTHGSPYPYDTHVPLLWYGWKIKPGQTVEAVSITDIAPTLAALLRILRPNGCTGKVIEDLWDN